MARVRYLLMKFFVLYGTLQRVCFGENSFNSFRSHLNKEVGTNSPDPLKYKILESTEIPSGEKIIGRKRLIFNEDNMNSPVNTEEHSKNTNYWARKKTNYSETETETENENQVTEYRQGYDSWGNGGYRYSFPEERGISSSAEVRPRHPFTGQANSKERFDWEKTSNIFENHQSRPHEEKHFKHFSNPESGSRIDKNYVGRYAAVTNDDEINAYSKVGNPNFYNKEVSLKRLNDHKMANVKNYNKEKVGRMQYGYLDYSDTDYYNRNSNSFWNPNFDRPEKGVIINFNTECPTPKHFNNHVVHKFIFTPKSPINTQAQLSSFQIPGTSISAHKMFPMYYL